MDNPQHYQPLSHALHPPHAQYSTTPTIYDPKTTTTHRHEEEDDDDEDDDDDEGMVEQQLNQNEPENHASNPASPHSRPGSVLSSIITFGIDILSRSGQQLAPDLHSKTHSTLILMILPQSVDQAVHAAQKTENLEPPPLPRSNRRVNSTIKDCNLEPELHLLNTQISMCTINNTMNSNGVC
jgi:hypothetical protein